MHQCRWARGLALPAIITALVIALAACGQITTPTTPQPQTPTRVSTQALDWTTTTVVNAATVLGSGDTVVGTSIALDNEGNPHIAFAIKFSSGGGQLEYASPIPFGGWALVEVAGDLPNTPGDFTLAFDKTTNTPHIAWATGSELFYASPSSDGWSYTSVLSTDNTPTEIPFTDLAFDSDGTPHIAYMAVNINTTTDADSGALMYVSYDSGSWSTPETAYQSSQGMAGLYPSLAFDSDHNPHISSYYTSTSGASLVYSSYSGSDWTTATVDNGIGIPNTSPGGQPDVLAIHGNIPHISYTAAQSTSSEPELRYTTYDSSSSTDPWPKTVVDGNSDTPSYGGSLALDSNGNPHIGYLRQTSPGVGADLMYAWQDDSGWHTDSVDTSSTFEFDSLAINPSNNQPYISYDDQNSGDLMLAVGQEQTAATITYFEADPSTVIAGNPTTFSWAISGGSGSESCTLDPGDGSGSITIDDCANTTSKTYTYTTGSDHPYTATLTVDGTTTQKTTPVKVETPEAATNDLITTINKFVTSDILKAGQANGLIHPLDDALRSLNKNDTSDAYNQLQDFINDVQAKTPTPLPTRDANELITTAQAIETSIGY